MYGGGFAYVLTLGGKCGIIALKNIFKKELIFMIDREMIAARYMAYYQLRLIISEGEKNEYTKEEILELIDKVTMAKEQET